MGFKKTLLAELESMYRRLENLSIEEREMAISATLFHIEDLIRRIKD